MQYHVPQFIDIEDKIFGPFTFKQALYIAGGAGLSFVLFKALPFFIAIFFIIPVVSFALALAFYKVNNRPFIVILESAFKFALKKKLYTWKKEEKKIIYKKDEEKAEPQLFVPRLSESKLKDIAWSLDVQESIYADQKTGKVLTPKYQEVRKIEQQNV